MRISPDRRGRSLAACVITASVAMTGAFAQTTISEGARLIIGDASAAVEDGAFVVENGHFTALGKRGSIKAPASATHIDLTGKTVMPTMNNVHIHIGYEGYVSWGVDNHTP